MASGSPFCAALAFVLVGCTTPAATEPTPDETFTMTTTPSVATAPIESEEEPTRPLPFGPGPWSGKLRRTSHVYQNGCTDRREVELLSLVHDGHRVPIILGWRRASPRHREEPRFLKHADELPAHVRDHACVVVTGRVVVYAHQGIAGVPAYAFEATQIDPAPCP